jgi:hypothetical protein
MKRSTITLDSPPDARLTWHGDESGTLNADMVEERAREIAIIEGRSPDQVTENDRDRARMELRDDELILTSDDARSDILATRNPAEPTVELGHEVESNLSEDEQEMAEKETMEGVREAEHERMLLSRDLSPEDKAAEEE